MLTPPPPAPARRANKLWGSLPRSVPAWSKPWSRGKPPIKLFLGNNMLSGAIWPDWRDLNPEVLSLRWAGGPTGGGLAAAWVAARSRWASRR